MFADTDGDQIRDGDEINGNRNPRVADLPPPEIEVGDDQPPARRPFAESNAKESRDLETKSVTSTLSQQRVEEPVAALYGAT